ncbi:MAG: flavodoxin-dependent (E)-4-hydroxy-3-methylbut-2-enyl-diphosphate synthase [Endomicrobiia bacterium]
MIKRKKTYPVKIGNLIIGDKNPIVVQTMTKTFSKDITSTIRQIEDIISVGGKIVRLAIPDLDSAKALKIIKQKVKIPLIADIHFDYKLAIESIKNGADKIRINPANIGSKEKIIEIIKIATDYDVAIRIGLNSGSYKKKLEDPFKTILSQAEEFINLFEKYNFRKIVLSAKTTDVLSTIEIYKKLAEKYKYPLHLGITEAGPLLQGSIKSALGIGILLFEGIGDTIRVSLTSSPQDEIKVGYYILQSLNLIKYGIDLISCPSCGRCKINLIDLVSKFEKEIENKNLFYKNLKVAIMGCEVNGPGEASSADLGIAMGRSSGVLFVKGKIIKKVDIQNCVEELVEEISKL